MAQVTNTYDTYTSKRGRETLSDVIYRIDPEETPFQSNVGTEQIEGTHPEWNTDALALPDLTNKHVQGDVYSFDAVTATTKVGNYTEIAFKEFIISETEEKVAKAGPRSDYNREMIKKGIELKTDMEAVLLNNQSTIAGNSSTAPQLGGLRGWLATNDDMGVGGASLGYNSGTGLVTAATNGTQRALTKAMLDNVIQMSYTAGGNPKMIMGSPYLKTRFSAFMSLADVVPLRTAVDQNSQATIIGAADEYLSDFGKLSFVVNRQMHRAGVTVARNLYVLDPKMFAVGILRPIQRDNDVAKTSDALPGVLKVEYTLIVRNERSSGVVADLFGTTAAS